MPRSVFSINEYDSPTFETAPLDETDTPPQTPSPDSDPFPRQYSDEYPPGDGDLQVVSCDNVVFHFHKWLLAYMSPVFNDMIKAGSSHRHAHGHQPLELKLTEHASIVRQLLQFVDPMKANPPLGYSSIVQLLPVASKYQIQKLTDWIKAWLNENLDKFLANKNAYYALTLLGVATRHQITKLAQGCLRIMITAPSSEIRFLESLPPGYSYHLVMLREKRVNWFRQEIGAMLAKGAPNTLIRADGLAINDPEYIEITRTVMNLSFEIALEPSYARLLRHWPRDFYSDYFHGSQAAMEVLMKAAVKLEAELPELPYGDRNWDN